MGESMETDMGRKEEEEVTFSPLHERRQPI